MVVKNTGATPLSLTAAVSGDFTVQNGCPSTLLGGSSCQILTSFAPSTTGRTSRPSCHHRRQRFYAHLRCPKQGTATAEAPAGTTAPSISARHLWANLPSRGSRFSSHSLRSQSPAMASPSAWPSLKTQTDMVTVACLPPLQLHRHRHMQQLLHRRAVSFANRRPSGGNSLAIDDRQRKRLHPYANRNRASCQRPAPHTHLY